MNYILIGICGGSASGKTTVARNIIQALDVQWVSLLSMDSFYKVRDLFNKSSTKERFKMFLFDLFCSTLL